MTESTWHRTHLEVPRADGAVLTNPTLDEAAHIAAANAAELSAVDYDVQGRSFIELRRAARREAVRLARGFTHDQLGDRLAHGDPARLLIVPGHQPALVHPGVWAKHFAAAGIAGRVGGGVLNLVVDNDLFARSSIDVPSGSPGEPQTTSVPFDAPQRPRPWERAGVRDPALFRSFSGRIAQHMNAWGLTTLAETGWNAGIERLGAAGSIAECLTAVRHRIEAEWGLHNLESPLSRLCQIDPFLRFAAHLFAHLPRFLTVYNGALEEYRALYRIKSKNHPVPPLEARGDWLEAPFWVWRDDAPFRRRVFARSSGAQTELADDSGHVFATLPLSETTDACCAVEVLRTLAGQGVRLRTRALTTTLFSRLFIADLFVHGIGGAKYDELTDRVIARFFGIGAPRFATVSASLYLPFASPFNVTVEDERRLHALQRDLVQNPQRHLEFGVAPVADQLMIERRSLLVEQDAAHRVTGLSRRERRERSPANAKRFRRLIEVTQQLTGATAAQRRRVEQEIETIRRARQANRILTSREFSFLLYPEEKIRPFLMGLATP